MAKIDKYEFPDDLYYDREHVWAKADGNIVTIGMSQFGQELAEEIVYIEVPRIGRTVAKGEAFMSLESGKWVGRVKAPLSGTIVAVNAEIEWESELVNTAPYGAGWLAQIEAADLRELDELMKPNTPEFAEFIAAEREKYDK